MVGGGGAVDEAVLVVVELVIDVVGRDGGADRVVDAGGMVAVEVTEGVLVTAGVLDAVAVELLDDPPHPAITTETTTTSTKPHTSCNDLLIWTSLSLGHPVAPGRQCGSINERCRASRHRGSGPRLSCVTSSDPPQQRNIQKRLDLP